MSQAETGTSTKSPRWYWEDFTPGLSMTFGPREVGREEIVQSPAATQTAPLMATQTAPPGRGELTH